MDGKKDARNNTCTDKKTKKKHFDEESKNIIEQQCDSSNRKPLGLSRTAETKDTWGLCNKNSHAGSGHESRVYRRGNIENTTCDMMNYMQTLRSNEIATGHCLKSLANTLTHQQRTDSLLPFTISTFPPHSQDVQSLLLQASPSTSS